MESVFVTKLIIASIFLVVFVVCMALVWRQTFKDYDIIEDEF